MPLAVQNIERAYVCLSLIHACQLDIAFVFNVPVVIIRGNLIHYSLSTFKRYHKCLLNKNEVASRGCSVSNINSPIFLLFIFKARLSFRLYDILDRFMRVISWVKMCFEFQTLIQSYTHINKLSVRCLILRSFLFLYGR
jgi:hypothetical protein